MSHSLPRDVVARMLFLMLAYGTASAETKIVEEADGKVAALSCTNGKVIRVVGATYDTARFPAPGNASAALKKACEFKASCEFTIDAGALGTQAPRSGPFGAASRGARFVYNWTCGPAPYQRDDGVGWLPGEASGLDVTLTCPAGSLVKVMSATYGQNVGATRDNALAHFGAACDRRAYCTYNVNHTNLGDPRRGSAKEFNYQFACAAFPSVPNAIETKLDAEAHGKTIQLSCGADQVVEVADATYGLNRGAEFGNATTAVRTACNGKAPCGFPVNVGQLGDPAVGQTKEFAVRHTCTDRTKYELARCLASFQSDMDAFIATRDRVASARPDLVANDVWSDIRTRTDSFRDLRSQLTTKESAKTLTVTDCQSYLPYSQQHLRAMQDFARLNNL